MEGQAFMCCHRLLPFGLGARSVWESADLFVKNCYIGSATREHDILLGAQAPKEGDDSRIVEGQHQK